MSKIKVALLYGGPSGEHEVSLESAASVFNQLNTENYDVYPIGMDKEGSVYLNDAKCFREKNLQALPVQSTNAECLSSLIVQGKFVLDVDVVFPVMHGPLCEDGAMQGLFELAGIAYVGCDVLSSAVSMDKDVARQLAHADGVKQIRYHRMPFATSAQQDRTWCEQVVQELGFPLFVKPCTLGSSVGIQRVNDMESLLQAVKIARQFDLTVLVEEFIAGREIELSVLEREDLEGLPDVSVPGEIKTTHQDGFYSYTAKYIESDSSEVCVPADLDEKLTQRFQIAAVEIFMRLHCVGLARVDFFLEDDTQAIYFNEINTLPGFTKISMFPKAWEASGLSYPALLDRLIRLAMRRHQYKSALITDYSGLS